MNINEIARELINGKTVVVQDEQVKKAIAIYGVLMGGVHVDVSKSIKGAKQFATRNGFNTVTVRVNCGYIARELFFKNKKGSWVTLEKGQIRYNK